MHKQLFPLAMFILTASLIIGSILFYAPSWGLVDDWANLVFSRFVWSGEFFRNLWHVISRQTELWMFRPLYYVYVVFAYHIFANVPLLLYMVIAVFNLATLVLWGDLLNKFWPDETRNKYIGILLYPLAFFIFTPFWNIFMYISSQQKFIIFFSALAVYFFHRGYTKERKVDFILSVLAVISGMLIHAEGVFLNMAMLLLSLTIFFVVKKRIAIFNFALNLVLFLTYLFYTVVIQLKNVNNSRYAGNLGLDNLAAGFMSAPALVKIFALISALYFCCLLLIIVRRKNKFSPVFLIFPLGYICFIAVLAPWGYPNYHLSVLTPFIMGMLFPFYIFLNSRSPVLKILSDSALFAAVLLVLFLVWFPRISKISDIKKAEQFIVDFKKDGLARAYFMPQPGEEACMVLGKFTKTNTIYLGDSLLSADKLVMSADNLIIFRDECPKAYFDGVQESEMVYKNNTWKIFLVHKKEGIKKEFKVFFPENSVERLKNLLKG